MPEQSPHDPLAALTLPWTRPGLLVGIDGSVSSDAALQFAVSIAPRLDLPVHAMVVWDYPTVMWPDGSGYYADTYERMAGDARRQAAAIAGRVLVDEPPEWLTTGTAQGSPSRVLIAASRDAAMLVVGSRGHGGFAGLLLGSVSSACTAHALCPVIVVPDPHRRDPKEH